LKGVGEMNHSFDSPSTATLRPRKNRFEARHAIHSFVREVRSFMHLK
jgi:hypothetical protein